MTKLKLITFSALSAFYYHSSHEKESNYNPYITSLRHGHVLHVESHKHHRKQKMILNMRWEYMR